MSTFSDNLKTIRTRRGLTQQKLADILNVSQNAIHNWESGKREPNMDTIREIADKLNVDVWYLVSKPLSTPDGFSENEYKERMHFVSRMENFYEELNTLGQEKALEYVRDLTKIPDYRATIAKSEEIIMKLDKYGNLIE